MQSDLKEFDELQIELEKITITDAKCAPVINRLGDHDEDNYVTLYWDHPETGERIGGFFKCVDWKRCPDYLSRQLGEYLRTMDIRGVHSNREPQSAR